MTASRLLRSTQHLQFRRSPELGGVWNYLFIANNRRRVANVNAQQANSCCSQQHEHFHDIFPSTLAHPYRRKDAVR